ESIPLRLAAPDLRRQAALLRPRHQQLVRALTGVLQIRPRLGEQIGELVLGPGSSRRPPPAWRSPHPVEQSHAPTLAREAPWFGHRPVASPDRSAQAGIAASSRALISSVNDRWRSAARC